MSENNIGLVNFYIMYIINDFAHHTPSNLIILKYMIL